MAPLDVHSCVRTHQIRRWPKFMPESARACLCSKGFQNISGTAFYFGKLVQTIFQRKQNIFMRSVAILRFLYNLLLSTTHRNMVMDTHTASPSHTDICTCMCMYKLVQIIDLS